MARIQILELPTVHHGDDDETPFAVIIDQCQPSAADQTNMELPDLNAWRQFGDDLGARAVLVTLDTVELPANWVTRTDDGGEVSTLRLRVEPDFDGFEDTLAEHLAAAQARVHEITKPRTWCCSRALETLGRYHTDDCRGRALRPDLNG